METAKVVEQPNPSDFSRNEREKNYTAIINVRGVIRFEIEADSPEDARRQAEAEVDRMERERYVEIDDVDEVELYRIYKDRPMFRVTREGKSMQVSHLEPGDQPRTPDKNGF